MKLSLYSLVALSLMGCCALLGVSYASPYPAGTRLWVQYRPGRKAAVRQVLRQAGAVFHYDFSDLDSFVVTLPQAMLDRIKVHEDVQDTWSAQVWTRSHEVEEPVISV